MDSLSWEDIIAIWKETSWGGTKFPYSHEDKIQCFKDFFKIAEENGYVGVECFPESILRMVRDETVALNYRNKQSLRAWERINLGLLRRAKVSYFNLTRVDLSRESSVVKSKPFVKENKEPKEQTENCSYREPQETMDPEEYCSQFPLITQEDLDKVPDVGSNVERISDDQLLEIFEQEIKEREQNER